jgi:alcohol dehydrogenase class IV
MGGLYHKPHGLLVGLNLPHVLKHLLPGDHELLAQIASALGANTNGCSVYEAAQLAIVRVNELLEELEFPALKDVGLNEKDIPHLAGLALGNACNADNPCVMTEQDYVSILTSSLS